MSLVLLTAAAPAQQPAPPYGGHQEFGLLAGYSGHGGPLFGDSKHVHYTPVIARYSWQIRDGRNLALRFAPELTLFSRLHETIPTEVDPRAPLTAYAAGLSPASFQLVARPHQRLQPFLSEAAGILYYNQRVLSPQGSQFMYTIDFGVGLNTFLTPRTALTAGFRYQHLSNANISVHNPGTDAQTFYVGASHFFTKGRARQ